MTPLLFGIAVSALLSTTSFLVVIFRVSPLSSPAQAIPAFFVSLFLAMSSILTLLLFALWRALPVHTWDLGKVMAVSVRQAVLIALGTCILIMFHMLGLLSWWIALLIYAVFVLVELAMHA
jgi:hypothetical protein